MPTYAIGDIQGCREQFEALLELINFDPACDKLWLVGDLVNRGPDSLGTMRLVYSIKDSVIVVLGNHDLHALAVNINRSRATRKDTLDSLLDADDAKQLLDWLRFRPLAHADGDYLMVHAGTYPLWDRATTLALAAEVEQVLRSEDHVSYFLQMYGNQPDRWSNQLTGQNRLRFITNALTRMRYCYADSSLDMNCKGTIAEAPADLMPWFDVPGRVVHQGYVLHGHWSALTGTKPVPGIISLGADCVWGNKLSAWCLEEKRWYSVPGYGPPIFQNKKVPDYQQ